MKKCLLFSLILSSLLMFSQEMKKGNSKFSLSLHYIGNLDDGSVINQDYKGIVGLDARYDFYQKEKITISGGLGIDYLQESSAFFKNDGLIFNPNIGFEVNAFNSKLKPFFKLGYSFLNYKVDFNTLNFDPFDPVINPQQNEKRYTIEGISLNPGLRYHFNDLFFAEASYRYIGFGFDTIAGNNSTSGTANTHYIQVGLGVKL